MRRITTPEEADAALAESRAVLFKYSMHCPVSLAVQAEVERFARETPGVPVYGIDVLFHRVVAQHVARRTGIRHESPQAIVVGDGRPVWHGSHMQITRSVLAENLPDAGE